MRAARRILHIDMDAFFAAVELLRHPELKGKPVIVGGRGDPSQRGVVSTASYEARKFGIHSGMPLRTAFRLCPRAAFLPVDFSAYEPLSKKIKNILRQISPILEDVGIDEAFLDISAVDESPENIARTIKVRIRNETGLTCSIGIAPNKLLAKIASDMEKPDGLTILDEGEIESRIWPLAVRKIPGVGPKTDENLSSLGVNTIAELAAVPLEDLLQRFGHALGHYLHRAARGIDDAPLVTEREARSIGRETTFQVDVDDSHVLYSAVKKMAKEVAAQLRKQHYRGRTVTVKLRYFDFETHTHSLTMERGTDDPEIIRMAVRECMERFAMTKKVRLVGVRISSLEKENAEHGSL